jgi:hypothetical protein
LLLITTESLPAGTTRSVGLEAASHSALLLEEVETGRILSLIGCPWAFAAACSDCKFPVLCFVGWSDISIRLGAVHHWIGNPFRTILPFIAGPLGIGLQV